jgi:hypothetical protein
MKALRERIKWKNKTIGKKYRTHIPYDKSWMASLEMQVRKRINGKTKPLVESIESVTPMTSECMACLEMQVSQ